MNFTRFIPYIMILISLSMAKKKNKVTTKPARKYEAKNEHVEPIIGPKGMPFNKTTSCETFGKFARFNPHSVVGMKWFVFYYWAIPQEIELFEFRIPSKRELAFLHYCLDGHLPKRFNWSHTLVLKKEHISNTTTLLEERNDRGQFLEYVVTKGIPEGKLTTFRSVRLKQTGDNKYLGLMDCKDHTAMIMSRINEVPLKRDLQHEASKLGFIGRKGKSYLYQGHEWMPISENSEYEFWHLSPRLSKYNVTETQCEKNGGDSCESVSQLGTSSENTQV